MFLLLILIIIVMLAGIIALTGLPNLRETELKGSDEGEFIELKGDKIRYFQKGEGPDILFIHDLHGIAEDWEPLVSELKNKYRVTLFDRPGQGLSSFHYVPYPLRYNVEAVTGLIDGLALKDIIIVGHSYGGSVALALAVQDIPQVKGYVLISPLAFPTGGLKLFENIAGYPVVGRGLVRIIKGFFIPATVKADLESAFNPDTIPPGYYEKRIGFFFQTKAIVSASRELAFFNKDIGSIQDYYSDINKPVLIIHGTYDKLNSIYLSQDLDNLIPDSKLIEFQEAGHMVQYSTPEKLSNEIDEFARITDQSVN
ncbi:MAG: alpha/beta hydrolase [Spirochaetales bacterium]|nr:alpha/beta hydrolase [Spirochaetales bacterium]